MKKQVEVNIILPPTASSDIDMDLVELTKYLVDTGNGGENNGGIGLGGRFGYGTTFENDTFMMHEFCWCERDDCDWCNGTKPNFLYKPTNLQVFWYKWIGRDMEFKPKKPTQAEWEKIFKDCIKSIPQTKGGKDR